MMEDNTILTPEASEDVEVRCHSRLASGKVPSERCLHTMTLCGNNCYVYGGKGKSGVLGDVHMLHLEDNTWTAMKCKGEDPGSRFGHSAQMWNDSIWFFGGMASGHATYDFEEQQNKKPMFRRNKGSLASDQECSDELFTLNVDQMEWEFPTTQGQSPTPRYKHTATMIPMRGGKARMFILGGSDEERTAMATPHSLDMTTLEWSTVTTSGPAPSRRFGHSATLLPAKRQILVLGGTDGQQLDTSNPPLDMEFPSHKTTKSLHAMTVYLLDVDTMTWAQQTVKNSGTGAEPSPRAYHSATLLGKNLFVTAGQVHYWLLANNHYIHGAYILEITKMQWEHNTIKGDSFIPFPGCSLLGHTATAVDSSSLVLFGGNLETTSSFEMVSTFWDVATDAKQKLNPSQLPTPVGGGAYNTTFKLLCVGDAGVGKTCLITRFVEDSFSENNKSTIGIDFKTCTIEMDTRPIQLQVWDTAGQERFKSLTASYYRGAHGVVLVYDVTDPASFEHLDSWMKDVNLHSGEEVVKLLIGNKCDVEEQKVVQPDVAKDFAKEHEMLWMEASAKTDTNVKAAFRMLVAEVMHKADTLASQPSAFEAKVKINSERSRKGQSKCGCS